MKRINVKGRKSYCNCCDGPVVDSDDSSIGSFFKVFGVGID